MYKINLNTLKHEIPTASATLRAHPHVLTEGRFLVESPAAMAHIWLLASVYPHVLRQVIFAVERFVAKQTQVLFGRGRLRVGGGAKSLGRLRGGG